VPAAALAPFDAITVTRKLSAPALQRGEPHTEQQPGLIESLFMVRALAVVTPSPAVP